MADSSYLQSVIFLILILFSGLFSASETAYTALNKARVRRLKEQKVRAANLVDRLLEDQPRLLSTILVGNNIVNILAASMATRIAIERFGNYGIGIATGLTTLLILVFGEITPKTYAVRHAEKVALITSPLISAISYVLYPVAKALVAFTNLILRLFGQQGVAVKPLFSPEELKAMVEIGEEEGVIEEEERKMIHSILEFGDTTVKEIMVPRTEIIALPEEKTVKEALDLALKAGYSRIPIYKETIDNITGILYVKDLLSFATAGKTELAVKELAREPYFVPETKRVDSLLREFQKNKIHMAIVVDEYGGTAGLVTLEDILEEIVGEIFDEYDFQEEATIEKISENEWITDGRLDIDAFEEYFELEVSEDESETLGGFVSTMIGHVPHPGESFEYEGYRFEVLSVSNRRVAKVKITRLKEEQKEEE